MAKVLNHPHHPEDKCGPGCSTMRPGPAIIELSTREVEYLLAVCERAVENGQTVKVTVDGGFKFKRGESMWTPPLGNPLPR